MNILIIKLSAIGDVILALPFLEALRRTMPEARITWLVEEAAADVVLGHPALDRVLVLRRKAWIKEARRGRLGLAARELKDFLSQLRAEKYDLVIDLQGLFKSAIFTFLSRGRVRAGFDRSREFSHLWYNQRMPAYDRDRHAFARNLETAAFFGADPSSPLDLTAGVVFPKNAAAAQRAAELLAPAAGRRVALNPGARWPTKLWPAGHWRDLARRLADEPGVSVVLTGAAGDRELTEAIADGDARILNLAGATSLKELAEVFRECDAVVSPDTGPMHLAAAVGTPVTAIFGPTAPWRSGPYGSGHRVLYRNLACAPCFKRRCPDARCMVEIGVDEAIEAVRGILAENSPNAAS